MGYVVPCMLHYDLDLVWVCHPMSADTGLVWALSAGTGMYGMKHMVIIWNFAKFIPNPYHLTIREAIYRKYGFNMENIAPYSSHM